MEDSVAAAGGRDETDHRGDSLPVWGVEMEPDRTQDVQSDQRQLGWGAAGQLGNHLEAHPHDADGDGVSLPCLSGPEGIPDAAACRAGGQGPGTAQAGSAAAPLELLDLAAS